MFVCRTRAHWRNYQNAFVTRFQWPVVLGGDRSIQCFPKLRILNQTSPYPSLPVLVKPLLLFAATLPPGVMDLDHSSSECDGRVLSTESQDDAECSQTKLCILVAMRQRCAFLLVELLSIRTRVHEEQRNAICTPHLCRFYISDEPVRIPERAIRSAQCKKWSIQLCAKSSPVQRTQKFLEMTDVSTMDGAFQLSVKLGS